MQDKSIIAIGQLKTNKKSEPYQNFIENMFPGKNYDMILAVFRFSKTEDNQHSCHFEKVDIEAVSEKNFAQFAYRKGSARGGDITFTTKFGDIEKKFKTFYPKQVKDLLSFATKNNEVEEWKIFNALEKCLKTFGGDVKAKLQERYEAMDKNAQKSSGFSIRFEGLEGQQYLDDFSTIKKLIYEVGTAGKSSKYKVISEGFNETCSICLEIKPKLHGFASPFKYSTVDKTGLVSGFFKQKNNWKNYPICSDCALDFELGKNYVTQHLGKYFYGKRYYMIPKTVVGNKPQLLKKALTIIEDLDYQPNEAHKLTRKEEHLMKRIGKEEGDYNHFALNLLFYEENQTTKAIKIKLMLEEIFPSRFRTLFVTVPKGINKNPLYKEAITIKKEKHDLKFNFGILKTFFEKDFYEIIQTVFLGLPISREVLFTKFMQIIRSNYNKAQTSDGFVEPTRWTVLKAHLTLAYLKELNIIPNHQTTIHMEVKKDIQETEDQDKKPAFDEEKFKSFIEENKDFFDLDNGVKAGIFSVGVLVKLVFNLQMHHLDGNTPFEKKLKGYHLNPEILKNVYVEALDKVSKYTKKTNSYQSLRDFINQYFSLNAHKLSKISNNELSFYFVAGLEFGNNFKTKKTK